MLTSDNDSSPVVKKKRKKRRKERAKRAPDLAVFGRITFFAHPSYYIPPHANEHQNAGFYRGLAPNIVRGFGSALLLVGYDEFKALTYKL